MSKQSSDQTDSGVRVEYRKIDDQHIRILTYRPELKQPIETIATLLPPLKGSNAGLEVKPGR